MQRNDSEPTAFPLAGEATLRLRSALERSLVDFLPGQRWFGAKSRRIDRVSVQDLTPLPGAPDGGYFFAVVAVHYAAGQPDRYFLPVARRQADRVAGFLAPGASDVIDCLTDGAGSELLFDAVADADFCRLLLRAMLSGKMVAGPAGRYEFSPVVAAGQAPNSPLERVERIRAEQSNTSIVYDRALILKVFRRLEAGVNPDLEIGRFLTAETTFRQVPLVHGFGVFAGSSFSGTVGVVQDFVANQGDGWKYTLDSLEFLRRSAATATFAPAERESRIRGWLGAYFQTIHRLGAITGQLHQALASPVADPAFAPEPVKEEDLSRWTASIESDLAQRLSEVRQAWPDLAPTVRDLASAVLNRAGALRARIAELPGLADPGLTKTRYHGDYHLGQVLWTGSDFVILDFEGEPARPLDERRAKHTPLKDVAGMLRSLNYARATARRWAEAETIAGWPDLLADWERLAREEFLAGYRRETEGASFVPGAAARFDTWIAIFELEKAIYELGYELNNRPDWVAIPLAALAR